MKLLSLLSCLLLAGCWFPEPPPSQECQSDLDCKLDRICEENECVSPEDGGTDSTSGSSGLECGYVAIECNCNPTNASPGYVDENSECTSGYQVYDVCGECQGGYAWLTYCYC